MKAVERYFHVVLFVMLDKVGLAFWLWNKPPVCDHSNESYRAVLSRGVVRRPSVGVCNSHTQPMSRHFYGAIYF